MANCGSCDGRYCDADTDGYCYRLKTQISPSRRNAVSMAAGAALVTALGTALVGTAHAEDNSPTRVARRILTAMVEAGVIYDYAIYTHAGNLEILAKRTASDEFKFLPIVRI